MRAPPPLLIVDRLTKSFRQRLTEADQGGVTGHGADEPTTALDASVQRGVLELLAELQSELGMAVLFVTHNLGLVAEMADHVLVMREGSVVEQAEVFALFENPQADYTRELLAASPRPPGTES